MIEVDKVVWMWCTVESCSKGGGERVQSEVTTSRDSTPNTVDNAVESAGSVFN